MIDKYTVATIAIVYNKEGELLITKRSNDKEAAPGLYSYPGGKSEYIGEEIDFLENNLQRELKEEVNVEVKNIEYFQSHSFEKKGGDKVVVVGFIAEYVSGDISKFQKEEVSDAQWLKNEEIQKLNTLPIIKQTYQKAADLLFEKGKYLAISVAGLVINEKEEFLLLRENEVDGKKGKLTFPKDNLIDRTGKTWQILEDNLKDSIYKQTNIEIQRGPIPFTDELFLGRNGFENIIQFYICKSVNNDIILHDKVNYSDAIWLKISDFSEADFDPLVYHVFVKANQFINKFK